MSELVGNNTIATVDYISAKISAVLSPAIANGWHMYRVQMQIEGCASIAYGLGLLILLAFLYKWMMKIYKSGKLGFDVEYDLMFASSFVVSSGIAIVASHMIMNGIMHLANPDYYVLQSLLEMIK